MDSTLLGDEPMGGRLAGREDESGQIDGDETEKPSHRNLSRVKLPSRSNRL